MREYTSRAFLKSSLTMAGFANLNRLEIAKNWLLRRGNTVKDL